MYMALMIKFIFYLKYYYRYIKIDYPENLRKLLLETGDSFYSVYIKWEIEE